MKLKHLHSLKAKAGRNDLNLQMPCHKSPICLLFIMVLTNTACKNKKNDSDSPASAVETNSLYKSLNDSYKKVSNGCLPLFKKGRTAYTGKCP